MNYTTDEVKPLKKSEFGNLSLKLSLYGWKVYTHGDYYLITGKEYSYYESMKQGSFVFIKFLSESIPIIGLYKKGYKPHMYESMNVKVLVSKDSITFIFVSDKDLTFKNKTNVILNVKNEESYNFKEVV